MPYLTRTWQAPGGWNGSGWPRDKVKAASSTPSRVGWLERLLDEPPTIAHP